MTPGSLYTSNFNPNHPVLLELSYPRITCKHLLYQNTKHRRPPLAVKFHINGSLIEPPILDLSTATVVSFTCHQCKGEGSVVLYEMVLCLMEAKVTKR